MNQQITIIGPIASGKTTASQFLSKELNIPLLDADLFETNPFLPDYIQDTPRWAFTTELFFTRARIKKLKAIKSMLEKSSVIVDSGLMSLHVYTKNHLVNGTMTAAEWEFFNAIITDYQSDLPSPDIIIHLTCSPKVQLARIKDRGRSFEADYQIKYLESITDRLHEYTESLANPSADGKKTQLLTIDTEKIDLTKSTGQKEFLSQITKISSL
jgi:deoxyadenosine/deoxycytidine kinase